MAEDRVLIIIPYNHTIFTDCSLLTTSTSAYMHHLMKYEWWREYVRDEKGMGCMLVWSFSLSCISPSLCHPSIHPSIQCVLSLSHHHDVCVCVCVREKGCLNVCPSGIPVLSSTRLCSRRRHKQHDGWYPCVCVCVLVCVCARLHMCHTTTPATTRPTRAEILVMTHSIPSLFLHLLHSPLTLFLSLYNLLLCSINFSPSSSCPLTRSSSLDLYILSSIPSPLIFFFFSSFLLLACHLTTLKSEPFALLHLFPALLAFASSLTSTFPPCSPPCYSTPFTACFLHLSRFISPPPICSSQANLYDTAPDHCPRSDVK